MDLNNLTVDNGSEMGKEKRVEKEGKRKSRWGLKLAKLLGPADNDRWIRLTATFA